MVQFTSVYEIYPSHAFGRPDGEKAVVPAGIEVKGPCIDTFAGEILGGETLSLYRVEPLRWEGTLSKSTVRVEDNICFITTECDSHEEAFQRSEDTVSRLLMLQALQMGIYFSCQFKYMINDSDQKKVASSKDMIALRTAIYSLEDMARYLQFTEDIFNLVDDRAVKSISYFSHALYIFQQNSDTHRRSGVHGFMMDCETILAACKAISCIIGDPTVKSDNYQTRYREYNICNADFEEYEGVRKNIRNNLDIAHYRPDWEAVPLVQKAVGPTVKLAQRIIHQYTQYLLPDAPTEPSSAPSG